jgi:hypothetical protein
LADTEVGARKLGVAASTAHIENTVATGLSVAVAMNEQPALAPSSTIPRRAKVKPVRRARPVGAENEERLILGPAVKVVSII